VKEGFGWEDQERVAAYLATHRGPVVLLNQGTERIVHLYTKTGFAVRFLAAPRRISCTGGRERACEVMATRDV
jgi:DNA adenine methylase